MSRKVRAIVVRGTFAHVAIHEQESSGPDATNTYVHLSLRQARALAQELLDRVADAEMSNSRLMGSFTPSPKAPVSVDLGFNDISAAEMD